MVRGNSGKLGSRLCAAWVATALVACFGIELYVPHSTLAEEAEVLEATSEDEAEGDADVEETVEEDVVAEGDSLEEDVIEEEGALVEEGAVEEDVVEEAATEEDVVEEAATEEDVAEEATTEEGVDEEATTEEGVDEEAVVIEDGFEEFADTLEGGLSTGQFDGLEAQSYNSFRATLKEGVEKSFHLNDSSKSDQYWSTATVDFTISHRSKVELTTTWLPRKANNGNFYILIWEEYDKFEYDGSDKPYTLSSATKKSRLKATIAEKGGFSIPAGHYFVRYVYRNTYDYGSAGGVDFTVKYAIKPLFDDVPKTHWAANVIADAVDAGYMSGYNNKTFGTNDTITRGQVATVLWNMEGKPTPKGKNPFKDVPSGKYYTKAVTWAASKGIVSGYGDGKFGPEDNVTRQQLAVMLYNYAVKYKGASDSGASPSSYASMSDRGSVSPYARNAVGWCFKHKLLSGSDGKIKPTGKATRAEAAKMFVAAAKVVK